MNRLGVFLNIDLRVNDFCNMNCKYCMSNLRSKNQFISEEMIDDFFNKKNKIISSFKNVNFTILGGEVTLLKDGILTYLVEKINSILNNLRISDYEKFVDIMIQNNIKIFRIKLEFNFKKIMKELNTLDKFQDRISILKKYIISKGAYLTNLDDLKRVFYQYDFFNNSTLFIIYQIYIHNIENNKDSGYYEHYI